MKFTLALLSTLTFLASASIQDIIGAANLKTRQQLSSKINNKVQAKLTDTFGIENPSRTQAIIPISTTITSSNILPIAQSPTPVPVSPSIISSVNLLSPVDQPTVVPLLPSTIPTLTVLPINQNASNNIDTQNSSNDLISNQQQPTSTPSSIVGGTQAPFVQPTPPVSSEVEPISTDQQQDEDTTKPIIQLSDADIQNSMRVDVPVFVSDSPPSASQQVQIVEEPTLPAETLETSPQLIPQIDPSTQNSNTVQNQSEESVQDTVQTVSIQNPPSATLPAPLPSTPFQNLVFLTPELNIVRGFTNEIDGQQNILNGQKNKISGHQNVAQGHQNHIDGRGNDIVASRAVVKGNQNVITENLDGVELF